MVSFRNNRAVVLITALVLVAMMLGACAKPAPTPPPAGGTPPPAPSKFGGVLKVAVIGNPPTLDVMRTTATITLNAMWHAYETLFALDKDYDPVPYLLKDYTVSPDGKVWTFNLRQGVKFHDGTEMVADDVVASIDRFGKLTSWGRSLFQVKDTLVAKDKYTVVLTLTEPTALVPLYLTSTGASIMPKYTIDEAGEGELKRFIGTGPFKFVEYEPDRHIKFERFADYSAIPGEPNGYAGNRTAYVDQLLFIPVPDTAVRIAGVQTGEYHFGEWIAPDEYERLKTLSGIVTRIIKPSGWTTAVFNKKQGLFTDVRMRQAFLAALDMEPIMKAAYGHPDFWRLDHGLMFQEQALYHEAGKQWYNQNNVERARQLLQEAGYKGQPVRWVTTTEYPAYYTTALVAKSQLERAGFVIDLQVVDWATVVERRSKPEVYDVFSTAFGITWDPVLFLCLSPTWPGWYESQEMQALLAQLRRETDFDKRYELWGKAQALFWEDVPVIKFGDYFLLHIHREEVRGYAARNSNFYWNVWIEKK
ncbi:MAG: ABC transporter substrate-binding protein [Bacillota bacterium]